MKTETLYAIPGPTRHTLWDASVSFSLEATTAKRELGRAKRELTLHKKEAASRLTRGFTAKELAEVEARVAAHIVECTEWLARTTAKSAALRAQYEALPKA